MNIFSIDGGLYRFLEKFTNFFLLNLLWFLMCLPIITIFPATAAMFGVVRQWIHKKDDGVFRNFFTQFKLNFKQSFFIGILWFILALLFYFNFNISMQMTGFIRVFIVSSLLFVSLFFTMTSIYLFPVMVHYEVKWVNVIKNSMLFSVSQLWITILCGLILLLASFISYIIPITFIIVWSIAAYLVYALCDRTFKKVESLVEDQTENEAVENVN